MLLNSLQADVKEESPKFFQNMRGGFSALKSGNHKQASKQFEAALRTALAASNESNALAARTMIGSMYLIREQYTPENLEYCKETLQLAQRVYGENDFRTSENHHDLASFYLGMNEKAKAVEEIEKIRSLVELAPDNFKPNLLFLYAGLISEVQDAVSEDAIEAYKRGILLELEIDCGSELAMTMSEQFVAYCARFNLEDDANQFVNKSFVNALSGKV